jgi:hypothetical protein
MNSFEEFIDFLASKGVKSFHIELQARELSETQERLIERKAREFASKHDVPEPIEQETNRLARLTAIAKEEGVAIITAAQKVQEPVVKIEPNLPTQRIVPLVVVEPEKTPEPIKDDPKVPEQPKVEPKMEKKAESVSPVPASIAGIPQKELYAAFCKVVENDDGTVTKADRDAMILRMRRDDLLRLNNDFQLGLDTDKPDDAIANEALSCFP